MELLPQHERLTDLVGTWRGEEQVHASPFTHHSRAKGTFSFHSILDGQFLAVEYTQVAGGEVVMRGHGVIGFDRKSNKYTLHWFDTYGAPPNVRGIGEWHGPSLLFEHDYGGTKAHTVFDLADGRLAFRALTDAHDGGGFRPLVEGTYRRDTVDQMASQRPQSSAF